MNYRLNCSRIPVNNDIDAKCRVLSSVNSFIFLTPCIIDNRFVTLNPQNTVLTFRLLQRYCISRSINIYTTTIKEIYVIKTSLMHYLSSVYFVNQPLHVSGIFVAHHLEVYGIYATICTCCALSVDCLLARPTDSRLKKSKRNVYILTYFLHYVGCAQK